MQCWTSLSQKRIHSKREGVTSAFPTFHWNNGVSPSNSKTTENRKRCVDLIPPPTPQEKKKKKDVWSVITVFGPPYFSEELIPLERDGIVPTAATFVVNHPSSYLPEILDYISISFFSTPWFSENQMPTFFYFFVLRGFQA